MGSGFKEFDKLREVGDLSYLVYFRFKCFDKCFGWVEALNGRLIGPKTWDRIVRIFGTIWTVHGLFVDGVGCWVVIYALNHVL